MQNPDMSSDRYMRSTIETRDTATSRLHQALVPDKQDHQLFLSFKDMEQHADRLKQSHDKAEADANAASELFFKKVKNL